MIVIAESGSTKTDWRIIGKKIHSFETPGLNPYFVNADTITKELLPFLNHETPFQIKEVHFYGTGITDSSKGAIVVQGVQNALKQNIPVYTYSDVIAAARALFGDNEGLACILGTGSNSCFWNGQSIGFQIPPLGFWLGDEGSGGHLGKSLLLSYLQKEMPQDVRDRFESIYGAKDRLEILNHAYQQEKPNRYFAQFCPFLHQNLNDSFCRELVKDSFRLFVEKYLLKYPQLKETSVGIVGSIAFHFNEILQNVFSEYEITVQKTVQKPIDALVPYHQIILQQDDTKS
jgi:glucosamine kinase